MDKTDLLNNLFYDHSKTLGQNFGKEFNEKVAKFRDKHLSDSDPEFVKQLYDEMPELSILDIQFIKKKLISINKSINTIRGVIVTSFVLTLIGIVIYLLFTVSETATQL